MKSILTLFTIILILMVIGVIFYGGYYAIGYLWNLYTELDLVIRIVLFSSMAVLLVGSIIIASAVKAAAQVASKNMLMEAKLELYKVLVSLYEKYIANPQKPSPQMQTELLTRLSEIESETLILANGSVLEIHGKLQAAMRDHDDHEKLVELFQRLVKSIRRDLGHGPNYDESKLKFLVSSSQAENSDRPNPGVSL